MHDDYHTGLKDNTWKLYMLFAIRGSIIHIPIIVLFWQRNGLSLQDIFIIHALFSITKVVCEMPSGYLSDRWGRARTITLGTVLKTFGVLCYALGYSFLPYALGVLFLALGSSMLSGTLEALTYDTLLELKQEHQYRLIAGKQSSLQFGTEAVGSILGGAIAVMSLRAPIWMTALIFGIAPIISFSLTEPKRHAEHDQPHLHTMKIICKETLIHNKALRSILIAYSILIAMTMTLFWFTQPYLYDASLPLALFGIVHALIVASHALASRYMHTLERWMDDRILLFIIGCMVIGSYVALGFIASLWGIIFFFIARTAWGALTPLMHDIVNRMVVSQRRATVLSLGSLGWNVLFAMTSPILGYLADVYTLQQSIFIAGVVGCIAIGMTFVMMRGVWAEIPK